MYFAANSHCIWGWDDHIAYSWPRVNCGPSLVQHWRLQKATELPLNFQLQMKLSACLAEVGIVGLERFGSHRSHMHVSSVKMEQTFSNRLLVMSVTSRVNKIMSTAMRTNKQAQSNTLCRQSSDSARTRSVRRPGLTQLETRTKDSNSPIPVPGSRPSP